MFSRHRDTIALALLAVVIVLAVALVVATASGDPAEASWWAAGYSGGESSGGRYTITDSSGQAAASHTASGDGQRYALTDGFWQAGLSSWSVYLPLVLNDG